MLFFFLRSLALRRREENDLMALDFPYGELCFWLQNNSPVKKLPLAYDNGADWNDPMPTYILLYLLGALCARNARADNV